jgi:hypothetical protein
VAYLLYARTVEPGKQLILIHERDNGRAVFFSVGPLQGYMTPPTAFCLASECSAVEGSAVKC